MGDLSVKEQLLVLIDQGITFDLSGDKLVVKGNLKALDKNAKEFLKNNKSTVISLIKRQQGVAKPAIVPRLSSGPVLLSYAQQRLWLLEQIDGGSSHYNIPRALKLMGSLNYNALRRAFSSIVERHEILRTCFSVGDNGEPYQNIQPRFEFDVAVIDLSALETDSRQVRVVELVSEEAQCKFDLQQDLMLRARLIKESEACHILLVTLHHIASDGWSMAILINEFSLLYKAYSQGLSNPLPPLEIQYADYANWQREWLRGEVLEQQTRYWEEKLAGLPVVHGLRLDRPRPKQQTFTGGTYRAQLDSQTTRALSGLCKQQGATLFMGLHAAFAVLLARYSGETDIVIGSPIANREQPEIAGLIGFFINTLVLRCDLSGNPNFLDLLEQGKETLFGAYAHQQVSFEQLVERLQPERSLNHSPLFQVLLVLQNNERGTLELPDLNIDLIDVSERIAKYDLTLTVTEQADMLFLEWEYNMDLFGASSIEDLARHFQILMSSLIEFPETKVFEAELLTAPERHQLLNEWAGVSAEHLEVLCVHGLFEARVNEYPNAIAIVCDERRLSYQQLNERANQLAHYLVNEQHLKPDTLVGVCFEHSLEMAIAILGVLKAGGAYVPLDPDYPQARLAHMIKDAALNTIITDSALLEGLPIKDVQALCLDSNDIKAVLTQQATTNLSPENIGLTPNHLAYVIYTSGSAGKPKGVMVEHRSLINLIHADQARFQLQVGDRFLSPLSLGFDAGNGYLLESLSTGACLYLVAPTEPLFTVIEQQGITHAVMPAALLSTQEVQATPGLKVLLSGGDRCDQRLVEKLAPTTRFYNVYGPTENTVTTSCQHVKKNQRLGIGKPITNVQCYVLSPSQNLVPVGCSGELHIGGLGLARGYLNNPELTAEKFIVNPYYDPTNPSSSKRLYKTGDLVRWLSDGNLEFLGRIDHQVKIRGFRIELGEIETALTTQAHVKDVIVLAKGEASDKRLVAYVVSEAQEEGALSKELSEQLQQHLAQQLPNYMIPSTFVVLEKFPLTPNGKVDRKALPEPDFSDQQAIYIAPNTELEKTLCDLWQEVLGVERVGLNDNFFRLGGHSLLATRLVSRINDRLKTNLSLKSLFTCATLAQLAVVVSELKPGTERAAVNAC